MTSTRQSPPGTSFREVEKNRVRKLTEKFLRHSTTVIGYPKRMRELHDLRIRGKVLRYTMELGVPAFGVQYRKCLKEIEHAVALMGKIHDQDCLRLKLAEYMQELLRYNRAVTESANRFSLSAVRAVDRQVKEARENAFAELSNMFRLWRRSDFAGRVERAMDQVSRRTHRRK